MEKQIPYCKTGEELWNIQSARRSWTGGRLSVPSARAPTAIMSAVKSHPGVVSYEDHHLEEYPGEIRWDILIRMELLTPLEHYLREQAHFSGGASAAGTLPVSEVVRLGQEIAGALAFCQRKNIIHRDVKPENIFIREAGQFKPGDVVTYGEISVGDPVEKVTDSFQHALRFKNHHDSDR